MKRFLLVNNLMVSTWTYKLCVFALALFFNGLQPRQVDFTKSNINHLSHFDKYKEVPVLNLNIYIMGREDINQEVSLAIGENVDFLNQEFNGEIQFHFDELFVDPVHAYLPDLYNQFFGESSSKIDDMLRPIEKQGGINVFVFDSYINEGDEAALTGFTPRLKSSQETYPHNSPTLDRVFISFEGLLDKTTLVHEMGHFFGLYHPWELCKEDKIKNGLTSELLENENHMSYSSEVNHFTSQQLEIMRRYALNYRTYLCQKIRRVNIKA